MGRERYFDNDTGNAFTRRYLFLAGVFIIAHVYNVFLFVLFVGKAKRARARTQHARSNTTNTTTTIATTTTSPPFSRTSRPEIRCEKRVYTRQIYDDGRTTVLLTNFARPVAPCVFFRDPKKLITAPSVVVTAQWRHSTCVTVYFFSFFLFFFLLTSPGGKFSANKKTTCCGHPSRSSPPSPCHSRTRRQPSRVLCPSITSCKHVVVTNGKPKNYV